MGYRANRKARKQWSRQSHAAKARKRQGAASKIEPPPEIDHYLKITIERSATNEHVVFECFEGDRIDNYSVHCNGKYLGIQSITTLTKNIRKALPRFRRFD
jgi:hypothetical protein